MMPGINCDRAFSSSNKVEGDLSRVFRKSLSSSILLPDKNLRLAKGDIFDELPVFKQHPVHHLHVDVGDNDDDSVDNIDNDDLVPSSASPPWKFGQVNWEIILYLGGTHYRNIGHHKK